MKRSFSLSLSVSALLTFAAASAVSAGTLSSQYALVSTPVATASTGYTTSITLPVASLKLSNWDVYATNPSGEALVSESGTSGTQLFVFDPSNPTNGLVAVGPGITTNAGAGKYSEGGGLLSDKGAVSGYSTDAHNSLEAWVYIPGTGSTVLAKTGDLAGATYASTTTTTFSQYAVAVAGPGYVAGAASRYSGTTTVGTDLWVYNPNNASAGAKIIPLISSTTSPSTAYTDNVTVSGNLTTYESGTVYGIDDAGLVLGASTRYMNQTSTSNMPQQIYGTDAWVYNGAASTLATSATQIGLLQDPTTTGSNYSLQTTYSATATGIVRQTAVTTISTSGIIGGATSVYSSSPTAYNTAVGTITWLYTPGTSPGNSPGTANFSYTSAGNNSFTANGYVSDGNGGKYVRVGLYSDSAHQNAAGFDASTVQAINANGQAAGLSSIFYNNGSSAISSASDAWYYPGGVGSSSVLISPSTTSTNFSLSYTYKPTNSTTPVTVSGATITGINASGWVAGYSTRYTYNYTGTAPSTYGQDAWVYDATNSTTYVVAEPIDNTASYFYSTIQYLSNDGIALGYYKTSSSGPTSLFAWYNDGTTYGDFYNIGTSTLANSLSSADWASLASLISIDANGDLYGLGVTSAANTDPSVNGVFELVPVPEPASLGLFSLAAVGLIARRRKA